LRTAYISHRECRQHDTGADHPEHARRLSAIEDQLASTGLFDVLRYVEAPEATDGQLLRVHTREHLDAMAAMAPERGYARLDPDTVISPDSLRAARRAAGAVVEAVDLVAGGEMEAAFCCVRPPGHHAESDRAMGFCIYNNIAVGAAHALDAYGLGKVAILDFDVHQGNGTEEIFEDENRVLFCSTFQHPFFPFTRLLGNAANRVNVPLDANIDDDMSYVSLTDADFRWVAEQIVQVAAASASGRIISVLEGGYELGSLARCVETHVRVLMGLN
jgi:acetoin utilization deacetylase AcuC-like enzyme